MGFVVSNKTTESWSVSAYLLGVLSRSWFFVAGAVVIMEVARVLLWVCHTEPSRLPGWYALRPGLELGFFNDAGWASAAALGWLTVGSLGLVLPERWRPMLLKATSVILVAGWLIMGLLGMVEFYYYEFYHSRFDPLIFGVAENDTDAVLGSIWSHYPVLRALIALGVGGFMLSVLWRAWNRKADAWIQRQRGWGPWLLAILCLFGLPLFPLLVFTPSHIMEHHIRITATDQLGQELSWNAPFALIRAVNLYHEQTVISSADQGLKLKGFVDLADAAKAAGLNTTDPTRIRDSLFVTAPGVPIRQHPNIVLMLLESFGADLLNTDNPATNDMLGRLRPHLKSDPDFTFFTHFYAGQNATHPEIENLLLGSPITPLTLSPGRDFTFANASVLPFQKAGYRTIFIYGGRKTRENLDEVLRHQGFDEVYDQADIQKRFPAATRTSWGVYDAYLFAFVQEVINKESTPDHPVFIFMLTTTNHPPYVLDTPHRQLPLDPTAMGPRGNPDMALRRQIMATYQYQADQLGGFLDTLDKGPHANDTLVAGAGDHNLHEHYVYKLPEERPDTDRVFGFFRVPAAYRPAAPINPDRLAGHKDIFPTLMGLALPGGRYFDTGVNLFIPAQSPDYGLSQFSRFYTQNGLLDGVLAHEPVQVHPWTRPNARVTNQAQSASPEDTVLVHQVMAKVALRDWFIRSQVLAHEHRSP
jgi:phosphoglycerol transferase MdoB-like AlkP superfamily enzyme